MADALDVVLCDIVHHLSTVGKHTTETAVDRLSHGPFEIIAACALAEDGGADAGLKVLVPQPVQAVLAEQVGGGGSAPRRQRESVRPHRPLDLDQHRSTAAATVSA